MKIEIIRDGAVVYSAGGQNDLYLVIKDEYKEGDCISFTPDEAGYLTQYSAEALYIRTANLSHCPFRSIRSMTAIMMPFTGEASISYGQGRHTIGNAVTAISRSTPMTHMRMNHSSRMRRQTSRQEENRYSLQEIR